jgi:hypothetical protein
VAAITREGIGAFALDPDQGEAIHVGIHLAGHDLGDSVGAERYALQDLAHDVLILGGLIAVTRCAAMLATERLGWGVVSRDEGLAGLGVAVSAGVPDQPPTAR